MIHRLPSGKMNFDTQHHCPYCKSLMDHNTPHDHFLICNQSQNQKVTRIKELNKKILQRWYTSPSLCNHIIIKIKDYYKMVIHDSEFDNIPLVSDYNSRESDELLTSQYSIR